MKKKKKSLYKRVSSEDVERFVNINQSVKKKKNPWSFNQI